MQSVGQILKISVISIILCTLFPFITNAEDVRYREETVDSAVLFRFVPGRLMFYYHYKDNEYSIHKADSLIKANMEAILAGDAVIRIKGFCTSWPTEEQNRRAAKNRSNQVKSWYIVHTGMKEEYYQTVNSIEPDTLYSRQGGADLVALLYVEKLKEPQRPPFVPVPSGLPPITALAECGSEPDMSVKGTSRPSGAAAERPSAAAEPIVSPSTGARASGTRKPLLLNIKTNLLYDAVGFPSLEVEIPIGRRFSINAEGAVAWWSSKRKDTFYQLDMLSPEER